MAEEITRRCRETPSLMSNVSLWFYSRLSLPDEDPWSTGASPSSRAWAASPCGWGHVWNQPFRTGPRTDTGGPPSGPSGVLGICHFSELLDSLATYTTWRASSGDQRLILGSVIPCAKREKVPNTALGVRKARKCWIAAILSLKAVHCLKPIAVSSLLFTSFCCFWCFILLNFKTRRRSQRATFQTGVRKIGN